MRTGHMLRLAMVAGAAASLWALGGCAGGPETVARDPGQSKPTPRPAQASAQRAPATQPPAQAASVPAAGSKVEPKQDIAAMVQESALRLEEAMRTIEAQSAPAAAAGPSAAPASPMSPEPVSTAIRGASPTLADLLHETLSADWGPTGPGVDLAATAMVVGIGADTPVAPVPPAPTTETIITADPKPPKPLPERVEEATLLLIDLLRQQSTDEASAARASLALAALEALHPGATQQVITPAGVEDPVTPEQRQAIETFRSIARAVGELPLEAPDLSWRVNAIAEQSLAAQPMRIANAALCTKVSGFGQFVPVASTRFSAGRANRVLVYVEVDNFAYRSLSDLDAASAAGRAGAAINTTDRYAVELSQELQLRHDPDGLLVWARPEQRVLETSRNRRRDFFLVDDVTFPATLSAGRYSLKIITRDKTTNATDEMVLPFELVAGTPLAVEPRGLGD